VRRALLGIGTFATLLGASAAPSPVQERPLGVHTYDFTLDCRNACDKGLAWLASRQNTNGSWNCKIGYKLYEDYHGEDGQDVGVTALACMAFTGAGNAPNRGKYGRVVAKGLDFILSCSREEDGYITANGSRMYSHAFAAMFLAEVYGMSTRPDVKEKLRRSVDLLVSAQNKEGGWRYQPIPVDADISVTVSVLQGLRAARNCGIEVPIDTIDRAMKYVRACATSQGFYYQRSDNYSFNDTRITYPLTACGVVSHYSGGYYDTPEVRRGLNFLVSRRNTMPWGKYHYFYGHYYASQAMYMAGGTSWDAYYPKVRDEILANQDGDGGWTDDVGRTYATAMACIVLQMPCELLPLFQK